MAISGVYPSYNQSIYRLFSLSIPVGAQIDGIELQMWCKPQFGGVACISQAWLSWDGGTNWSTGDGYYNYSQPAGSFYMNIGGPTSKWGRTWSVDDFSNTNFRLKHHAYTYGGYYELNTVWVKVYYSTEVPEELQGVISGESALAGLITPLTLLAGNSNGVAALSGDMVSATPIAGIIPGVSSVAAAVRTISDPLAGQVSAVSNVGGFVRPEFSVLYVPNHVEQMKNRLIEQFK